MQRKEDGSYQKSTLFTLFNERDKAHRPVIITANKDDDWKPWLHEAILSRLFGRAEVIALQGQDYRLLRALQKGRAIETSLVADFSKEQ
jgi:DNA replication protein DnaC